MIIERIMLKKTLSTKEWQFDLIIKMTGLKLIYTDTNVTLKITANSMYVIQINYLKIFHYQLDIIGLKSSTYGTLKLLNNLSIKTFNKQKLTGINYNHRPK